MPSTLESALNSEKPAPIPDGLGPHTDPAALRQLLDSWMSGDATEQRETFDALRLSLNEGRPADYRLFP